MVCYRILRTFPSLAKQPCFLFEKGCYIFRVTHPVPEFTTKLGKYATVIFSNSTTRFNTEVYLDIRGGLSFTLFDYFYPTHME